MPLGWIEFIVFTMTFNANITTRVNGEFLWGRHNNIKGLAGFAKPFFIEKKLIPHTIPHMFDVNQGKKKYVILIKNPTSNG